MFVSLRSNKHISIFFWLVVLPIYCDFIFCILKEIYNRGTKFWSILCFDSTSTESSRSLREILRSFGFVAPRTVYYLSLFFQHKSSSFLFYPCST
nr:MAG TPA: Cas system-associated protein [Caudoviricetes sp.]